jgi:hypothetical protein
VLAEAQEGIATSRCALVRCDAQHVQQGERSNSPLCSLWLGFVVTPMTFRVLKGEQLFHQWLIRDGYSGFLHFGVTARSVKNINQCPVTDGWVFGIVFDKLKGTHLAEL